jgi:hypothetical protein
MLFSAGCDRSPKLATTAYIEVGVAAANRKEDEISKAARSFLSAWLADHGETNIVNDETGVGVDSSPTRLWAFRGKLNEGEISTSEVEFRIVLPDGREIVEFVAGLQASESGDDRASMAMVNFCMSTLHVVYSCFMNQNDPHMTHKDVTLGGKEFILTSGEMFAFGNEESLPDFSEISKQIEATLLKSGLKLSSQAHWLKIVYGHHDGKEVVVSVTLDNEDQPMLTDRISQLSWPHSNGFYMAKEFIVLRPKTL